MKKLFFIVGIAIVLLSQQSNYAQTIKPKQLLKNVEQSISKINTVIYKINRANKDFATRDTIHEVAICSLYMAPKDVMKAYHIADKKSSYQNRYSHYQYDGINSAVLPYKIDSVDIAKKVFIYGVSGNNHETLPGMGYGIILRDIFQKDNIFRQATSFSARSAMERMELAEEVFLDTPVYALSIYGKNKENRIDWVNNVVVTFYIRKSDFLPIGYRNSGEHEGMKNYEYYEIEYLEINPELTLNDFKIDTSIKMSKPREYYNKLEKFDSN